MAASKKRAGKKPAKTPKFATPPPDDPLLRHEETDFDRVLVDYDEKGGATKMTAAEAQPIGSSPMLTMAQLRLEAIGAKLSMASHETTVEEHVLPIGEHAAASPAAMAGEPPPAPPVTGASNWVQLGPAAIPNGQTIGGSARVLVSGRVTSLAIDPTSASTIYLGAAQGGVWKTLNAGSTWIPMSDNEVSLAIGALAIDPSNPQTIYAGTGEGNFSGDSYYGNGLLKSTNGGATWTTIPGPFVGARFCRIAITPGTTSRIFAATTFGLFRSLNSGANWTLMTGLPTGTPGATDVVIDPVTPTTVYVAFWGAGIFKTTNAGAATPTWTLLSGGLPSASTYSRVALGISQSSPQNVFALMSGPPNTFVIDKFFTTANGGTSWTSIALPGGNIGNQGFYNLNVYVDRTTPNVVYLSVKSLWKAVKTAGWSITDIGGSIHADNHAFAMHPTNPQIVYAGNDGGIFVSTNGGTSWSDKINKGLCIGQFEFISNYPTSDAIVLGGTQDNGTEQFRNDAVFYHSDDGDGGFTIISQTGSPDNCLGTYFLNSPKRSTIGGKFGSWVPVSTGVQGNGLFYPPMVADKTNANNVAFGTDRVNLDAAQGTGGWPVKVLLPGITGKVSAMEYVNSILIYAGTTSGQVYVLRFSGSWSAALISSSPLPAAPINDLATPPGQPNTVIVVFGGFNIHHVWRGNVTGSSATWTDIDAGNLPNIPCDALVIDPASASTYYLATDVAVFRTANAGANWASFTSGLPNCAIFDLALQSDARVLRAATHGRGLWEKKLDVVSEPAVDLYFRDHTMSTGRIIPPPVMAAGYADPLQVVTLGQTVFWWMCADIKVDTLNPNYQFPFITDVDYLAFESQLQQTDPHRGEVNRVYVQVHNRGFQAGASVTVKLLYADASAGLPPLPGDFWPNWPGNGFTQTNWHPVGVAKTFTNVLHTQPAIVEFDWTVPAAQATHTCLLVIMDSPSDPIPPANKVTNIGQLVTTEKRVGLRNQHVITVPPLPGPGSWATLDFFAATAAGVANIQLVPGPDVGDVDLVFPKAVKIPNVQAAAAGRRRAAAPLPRAGLVERKLTGKEAEELKGKLGDQASKYDLTRAVSAPKGQAARIVGLKIPAGGIRSAIHIAPPARGESWLTVVQEEDGQIVGGSTYVFVKGTK
jgi:photosystem II stability/assembly factor-like uncharacterized protein